MKRDIEKLKADYFDILVIGGGINGCAIARDASLRGANTALIEKNDFASGASGKTTKLIHGGIRYLEQFNFKLVFEALRERRILLKTVPHLVKPIEFIILSYKDDPRSLLKIKTGVFIYDLLAGGNNICSHRSLNKNEVIALEKDISSKDLKGAVSYYDAQMDDVRLCLDNAISAYQAGCCVANKIEAIRFVKEKEKIIGVEAQDKLTDESFLIRAKVIVNATGAWSNRIVKMDDPKAQAITRPTKGVHIIYRKLPHKYAVLFSARKDKRLIFVIPWKEFSLIGTTDTDFSGSCDDVHATLEDIEYLLDEARRIFPKENINRQGIITTFAGLRPLVNTHQKFSWKVSREHMIKESASGLISVVGGKYTTYRPLAQQVTDIALIGTQKSPTFKSGMNALRLFRRVSGNYRDRISRYVTSRNHTGKKPRVLARGDSSKLEDSNFKKCITDTVGPSSGLLAKESKNLYNIVEYAVKEEMANTLSDLLFRRLQYSAVHSFGLEYVEKCADIMADILKWDGVKKDSEINLYKEEVRKNNTLG